MKSYKKDQRGITHHLMLAGIAVLVLGVVGFAGFKVYKSKNDVSAQAYNWTTISDSRAASKIQACKTSSGSNWIIRARMTNIGGYPSLSWKVYFNGGTLLNGGTVATGSTSSIQYTSKPKSSISYVTSYLGGGLTRTVSIDGLTTC